MPAASSVPRILDCAEAKFAAGGFGGTTLSSIAKAAGLGNPGLLHHYPSKAALYRAVLEAVGEDLDQRMEAATAGVDGVDERLRALLGVLVTLGRERPTALRLVMQEFLDDTGRLEKATVLPLAGAVRRTLEVIEAGQGAGEVDDGDPLAIVARLHGTLFYGLLGTTVLGRIHVEPGQGWAERLVEAALDGVLVTSPARSGAR
ncbi:MAG: TetR/AcrR family transcriptional regulator [Myxococcota bacterium]